MSEQAEQEKHVHAWRMRDISRSIKLSRFDLVIPCKMLNNRINNVS